MQAKRFGDDIRSAVAQAVLEQSIGQQVGSDDDPASTSAAGHRDRVCHPRGTRCGKGEFDSCSR